MKTDYLEQFNSTSKNAMATLQELSTINYNAFRELTELQSSAITTSLQGLQDSIKQGQNLLDMDDCKDFIANSGELMVENTANINTLNNKAEAIINDSVEQTKRLLEGLFNPTTTEATKSTTEKSSVSGKSRAK